MSAERALEAYLAGIAAGDRRRAAAAIDEARAAGLGLRDIYLDVLQPALREVGRRWESGAMTVAQEHLATAITQAVMSRLAADQADYAADGPVIVAACVDAERHAVGLRMLCDLLEAEGWTALYLGPSVPAADLARMVEERRPRAIALSVALAPHLLAARDAIARVRALDGPHPVVLLGGRAVTDEGLATRLGADVTATDAGEAVRKLRDRAW